MLYAVKRNKQLKIDAKEKGTYLTLGYDIARVEDGKLVVIEEAPDKKVPAAQLRKAQEENTVLKAEIAKLKAALKKAEKGE